MTFLSYLFRTLAHHFRMSLAVAAGVAVATAVLTGALLVGDSMTGSLRDLALGRLGRIDTALLCEGFCRQQLAEELSADAKFRERFSAAVGVMLIPRATLEFSTDRKDAGGRAAGVLVLGVEADFWKLSTEPAPLEKPLGEREVILNEPLAAELRVQVGDEVLLRLPKPSAIPADSALGRKNDTVRNLAGLKVVAIIPARGLGRFTLNPSQHLPHLALTSRALLQRTLEQPERVNAIFAAAPEGRAIGEPGGEESLESSLRPKLTDVGLEIARVQKTWTDPATKRDETVYDFFQITSNQMLISPTADAVLEQVLAAETAQPALTYLANSIARADPLPAGETAPAKEVPYSTIAALDSHPKLGPLLDAEGKPLDFADDELVLVDWAANRLAVKVGDRLKISYFEPESSHGVAKESTANFRLKAIVPLTEPARPYDRDEEAFYEKRPTLLNDPSFTPSVKGLTDQASLSDWDAPFPFNPSRVRKEDDEYWDNHRGTPKAYLSLAAGRKIWGSRFGQTTSWRIAPRSGLTLESLSDKVMTQLARDKNWLALRPIPIAEEAVKASSGTTPFAGLFLGFSFFLIASAVMLTALLFRLGVEQRGEEIGLLLGLGFSPGAVLSFLLAEGGLLATLGAAVGVMGGVGYAWAMLAGLKTWWLAAVVTPFLELHVTPLSLGIGFAVGVVVSLVAIWFTVRGLVSMPVRRLIAGQVEEPADLEGSGSAWARYAAGACAVAAIGAAIAGSQLGGEAQAGAFFAAGAAALSGLLLFLWDRMQTVDGGTSAVQSLASLAASNAARHPGRSTLTLGLVAAASFLILAIGAFHLAPTEEGAGGFDLAAESDQAIYQDLDTKKGRSEFGFTKKEEELLAPSRIIPFRVQAGDDASCLNLYQAARPRVLGVSTKLADYFEKTEGARFAWSAKESVASIASNQPWRLLEQPADASGAVPVVIDQATAMYSLHLYFGIGEIFEIKQEDGSVARFRVVGLLANSLLQGSLLIGEEHFLRLYPRVSGYRYFLIHSPPGEAANLGSLLEEKLGDQGFDAISSRDRLAELLAVQNTYLSTFQSLGALGLLLGTFGLAIVQLRNVLERRGELALLRATGFDKTRVLSLVLWENASLLVRGLGVGVITALVAISPQLISRSASVPLGELAIMFGVVLLVGLATATAAVWSTLDAPILEALRED